MKYTYIFFFFKRKKEPKIFICAVVNSTVKLGVHFSLQALTGFNDSIFIYLKLQIFAHQYSETALPYHSGNRLIIKFTSLYLFL